MPPRAGTDREQPIRLNLEQAIEADNPVCVIDAYVDSLDLDGLGFSHVVTAETGSPPYHPGDLLTFFCYSLRRTLLAL